MNDPASDDAAYLRSRAALARGFEPLILPFRKAVAEVRRTGETVVVEVDGGKLTVTPEIVARMDAARVAEHSEDVERRSTGHA